MNPAYLTTTTEAIDPVFMFIFGTCLVLLVGITAVMIGFVIRYHRSRSPEPTSQVAGNIWLEIVWTVLPTILVLVMFYYGWAGYLALRNVPKDALEVTATARMWSWSFSYPNGQSASKLYVPVNKPVKVRLVSKDVIHGFYLPAFRVKRDVVPGMNNQVWFVATKPGSYDLFCSSYCGSGHSAMISTVEALPEAEFNLWLQQTKAAGNLDGKTLLEKHGCLGCHSLDGSPGVGPTFKALFGSQVKVLRNNRPETVTADEAFLKESIRQPTATIVVGFQPIMPTTDLSNSDLQAMIEYIKGLK